MSVFALLERLAPHMEKEVNLMINSKQEAEGLSSKLRKIQVGLQDAERKGVTDDSVKEWLKELEDVAYEMDDVLDEWQMADLQLQLQPVGSEDLSAGLWKKVRSLVLSLCLSFKHVWSRREITKKMKALSDRIDNILKEEKNKYNFVPSENDRSQGFKQEPSISLVNESEVYGRVSDKVSLVEKLVSEGQENDDDGNQIVSVVGIGGVGKTTLAQLVYNDPQVHGLFDLKAWISVSEPFDASAIARAILEAFGESFADAHNLETLVQRIKKAVQNKKILLVLDNVWKVDRMKWERLRNCLRGAKGSRILVTTRNVYAARKMGTAQWQRLGLLSDSDCGTILNGIALEGKKMEECEKLRGIGIEIAKKCNGLPLAAVSVGSMLALTSNEEEWRAVLESPLWEYENEVGDTFHLLNLSYIDLSPVLKRCFLSCVLFPKGALINIDKITRIWMAYGYLRSNGNLNDVQLKALQYFNDLAMRSFFQKLESDEDDGDIMSYKMHDIMYEFANYLSGSEHSFIMDGGVEKEKSSPRWNSLERLRTFCARYVSQEELLLRILGHLRSVRVLSMCQCNLRLLPQEIGKLIHLRYLDLSGNPLRELPETVCDLHNLQTLGLENCESLSSLPQGIEKLVNLRHLLNSGAENLVDYPQGLEKLTGLWTISEFRGSKLGCLRNLNQLQGSLFLCLRRLNATADGLEEVRKANLRNKTHIKKLKLEFGEEEERVDIVDALQPPPNLHTLVIRSSRGKWLSHWIDTSSFNNLKTLEFNGYGLSSTLPPFGKLPALEKLVIRSCSFKCLSMEFLGLEGVIVDANGVSKTQSAAILLPSSSSKRTGCFPRLKKLRFENCVWWEEWEDIKEEAQDYAVPIMTCLEELEIERCPDLKALPHALLRQATSLRVLNLPGSQSLYDRYNTDSGYERHNIPHIQIVKFNYHIKEKLQIAVLVSKAALGFMRCISKRSCVD